MKARFRYFMKRGSGCLHLLTLMFVCAVFPATNSLHAQAKISSALVKPDSSQSAPRASDSLALLSGSVKVAPELPAKSGNLAMLLSAVLPGAGQVYAHRYYTIPIIWGFGIYFASIVREQNSLYLNNKALFAESVRQDTVRHAGNPDLLSNRDFYRNQRDEFIFYLALTYLLNIVDAYVGATLYSFDVSDNLGGSAALQLRIPFH